MVPNHSLLSMRKLSGSGFRKQTRASQVPAAAGGLAAGALLLRVHLKWAGGYAGVGGGGCVGGTSRNWSGALAHGPLSPGSSSAATCACVSADCIRAEALLGIKRVLFLFRKNRLWAMSQGSERCEWP